MEEEDNWDMYTGGKLSMDKDRERTLDMDRQGMLLGRAGDRAVDKAAGKLELGNLDMGRPGIQELHKELWWLGILEPGTRVEAEVVGEQHYYLLSHLLMFLFDLFDRF